MKAKAERMVFNLFFKRFALIGIFIVSQFFYLHCILLNHFFLIQTHSL